MRLALAVALVAAAAAVGAGAAAAPPRPHATVDCDAVFVGVPPTTILTGRSDLTLATMTFDGLAHLGDPVTFRALRRGGHYRIPTYAENVDQGPVTVAARGPGAVSFAFGPRAVAARTYTFEPCHGTINGVHLDSVWKGTVMVTKAGCYTFAAQVGTDVLRKTIPLGVARRC